MAYLVLQQPSANSTTFSDVIKFAAPVISLLSALIAAGSLLILLKYRVGILEKATEKNKEIVDQKIDEMREEFHNELKYASSNLAKATSDIQLIASNQNVIQKLTTDTLGGLLNRIEEGHKIMSDHTTMLACVNKDIQNLHERVKELKNGN